MWIRTEPLFRPSTIAVAGLALSAGAWFFPDVWELNKAYRQSAHFTFQSFALLADWWLLIFMGLRAGEIVGARFFKRAFFFRRIERIDSYKIYFVFTSLSALGLTLTYVKILSTLSIAGAIAFVVAGSGNQLKNSLYEEYSAGVLSLRYLVIYSASLSVYRFAFVRKWDFLYVVNAILLVASALLSSRLIFVATVLASLFLVFGSRLRVRLRVVRIALAAFVGFVVLSSLNASRNSNYYERDNLYFWGAGVSSIVTYLSAPFQSSIGTANHILEVYGAEAETYRSYVDVDETLNSNSAFVQNGELFGFLEWPHIAILTFLSGFIFSSLQRYGRSSLLLPCAAILYAASELWRLDLFRQGIFLVWLICGLAVPFIIGLLPRSEDRRRGSFTSSV